MRGLAGVDAGTTAIVSQLGPLGPSVRVTVQVSYPGPIYAGHCTGFTWKPSVTISVHLDCEHQLIKVNPFAESRGQDKSWLSFRKAFENIQYLAPCVYWLMTAEKRQGNVVVNCGCVSVEPVYSEYITVYNTVCKEVLKNMSCHLFLVTTHRVFNYYDPLSKLSLFLSLPVCRRSSLLTGEEGGVHKFIRPRESLALCKSFYTLWSLPSTVFCSISKQVFKK